ncbi:MAG: ABC transporter ATP-binding protein [Gammaproteobacteria bacterium]|nr:ABC transporter ATP-binding protein [Gammaproteobacteria bacterium]
MVPNITHKKYFLNTEQLSWQVKQKLILDKLSFSIYQGEFVGVIGPNGAGKSSLLRCLYKKIEPTAGQIQFNNKPLSAYSRRQLAQKIAIVLQEPPTHFELSVLDVIRMGLIPNKPLLSFDSDEDYEAIIDAGKKVELFDKLHQSFNSLSGGEKQRAIIARAILQNPQLLIMDEPTNHLDVRHQIEVLELAVSMGITVMVTIHDLNLAASFCDRLILLDQGRIIADGTPETVLTKTTLIQVFGVDAKIDEHPFSKKIRVTFDLPSRQAGSQNYG